MKVYRVTLYDQAAGAILSWHSTKKQAMAALKAGIAERGEPKTVLDGVELLDIPTSKGGLLGWLNSHFKSDNG